MWQNLVMNGQAASEIRRRKKRKDDEKTHAPTQGRAGQLTLLARPNQLFVAHYKPRIA